MTLTSTPRLRRHRGDQRDARGRAVRGGRRELRGSDPVLRRAELLAAVMTCEWGDGTLRMSAVLWGWKQNVRLPGS